MRHFVFAAARKSCLQQEKRVTKRDREGKRDVDMMIIWHTRRPSTRCPGATFSFHENQLNEFVYMSWLRRGKRVKTKSGKRKTENKNTRFKCMQSVAGRECGILSGRCGGSFFCGNKCKKNPHTIYVCSLKVCSM